ncbi:TIGR01906 family membrane protein [Erysipelothrix sp. HDW6C]|uniref:TIGR01906 family membrane protein n=1 Tax=Erysipelothrix sp. HDW6C TaxID=2714930 RepID=UPI00140B4619|nr:TIGR01906 family membrane protein [Erysipelothrix sp. HDW6C]QIK70347.1 TIGR01906 family membrane protein [Erysipelothrix sp. HDW6C]
MKRNLYVVAVMLFILNIVISAILMLSFNRGYYAKTYRHLNTAETIGISDADLKRATNGLLDYIKDKRDDLDIVVTVAGEDVQMFNQREKDHMVDVKDLYLTVVNFRSITTIFVAIMLVVSLGSGDYLDMALSRDTMKVALSCLGLLFGVVGVFAILDFQSFWITFHKIVFSNDLWLLDPRVDRLIMMVPERFFMGLVYRIIAAVVAIAAVSGGILMWLERVVKKNDSRRTV